MILGIGGVVGVGLGELVDVLLVKRNICGNCGALVSLLEVVRTNGYGFERGQ